MITPGQASRIACWISRETLTSHEGRWPLPGACWRRWMCMTLAPALNAAFASRAISSGVTGTWCCFGSVSTPFSAQVMTALSPIDEASPVCSLAERCAEYRNGGRCHRRQRLSSPRRRGPISPGVYCGGRQSNKETDAIQNIGDTAYGSPEFTEQVQHLLG